MVINVNIVDRGKIRFTAYSKNLRQSTEVTKIQHGLVATSLSQGGTSKEIIAIKLEEGEVEEIRVDGK